MTREPGKGESDEHFMFPGGGAIYATVPAGAMVINKSGATYYLSGNTWFKPAFGANGVYYTVVPTP